MKNSHQRIFNFSPGPAAIPIEVLERINEELFDWRGLGLSVLELGHRTKPFMDFAESVEANLRALLAVPANYKILFLNGAARMQFAAIPMNLLNGHATADYVDAGFWSGIAIQEAKKYCSVNIVSSGESQEYLSLPAEKDWHLSKDAAYLHYTANETFVGLEFHDIPAVTHAPLVADMTSNFLSRPLDVSRFGAIYAGAQKNAGIAGMTIMIVREDLIKDPMAITPMVYDYKQQAEKNSLLVTPPVFCWYVAGLVFDWLQARGGLSAMAAINDRKAEKLYAVIDRYPDLYRCRVDKKYRSRMNVGFYMPEKALEERFLTEAAAQNLHYLRGHSVMGGIRASIYNYVPEAGVDVLAAFMQDFAKRG